MRQAWAEFGFGFFQTDGWPVSVMRDWVQDVARQDGEDSRGEAGASSDGQGVARMIRVESSRYSKKSGSTASLGAAGQH